VHDVTQHRSAGPVNACGEVIHFLPRPCVKASIRANSCVLLAGSMVRRWVHGHTPSIQVLILAPHVLPIGL
jgi:hypothetical protein